MWSWWNCPSWCLYQPLSPHPTSGTMYTAWGTWLSSRLTYYTLWWAWTDSVTTKAGPIRALPGNFYEWDLKEIRPLFSTSQKPKNAGWELPAVNLLVHRKGSPNEADPETSWAEKWGEKGPQQSCVRLWVLTMTEARSIVGLSSHMSQ